MVTINLLGHRYLYPKNISAENILGLAKAFASYISHSYFLHQDDDGFFSGDPSNCGYERFYGHDRYSIMCYCLTGSPYQKDSDYLHESISNLSVIITSHIGLGYKVQFVVAGPIVVCTRTNIYEYFWKNRMEDNSIPNEIELVLNDERMKYILVGVAERMNNDKKYN